MDTEAIAFCECSDCGHTWEQEPADAYKCDECKSLDVIVATDEGVIAQGFADVRGQA